ncbi:MAG: hypothetical protein IT356_13245, partial [Gemmatimonadaceae bacterium]|nr:hypothetical protein [Gemmatimonadaceae bacterium]
LPPSIEGRKKMKFSEGAGSAEVMAKTAEREIPRDVFERERVVEPDLTLRSPEELYYYRIWREVMGAGIPAKLVGRTRDRSAAVGVSRGG